LAEILSGLRERHTVLASGRMVDRPADAIRWMLNQVYELGDERVVIGRVRS
jgi:hypothetical protein